MIRTKEDLKEYLIADCKAQYSEQSWLERRRNKVFRMKVLLRKSEYHLNNKKHSLYHKLMYRWYWHRCSRIQMLFCSEINPNVFGKGLIIWHPERIITNVDARVGDYCSISSGVVIAQAHNRSPQIGNSVEFMIDSKALGGITIADHVRIGANTANTMVIKDIMEPNTTWGGSPAYKISDRGTIDVPVPGMPITLD